MSRGPSRGTSLTRKLPIVRLKTLTTTETKYQVLLSYEVPSDALRTVLEELSVTADANAKYRLVLGNKSSEQFRDETLPSVVSLPWRHDNELFPSELLELQIRSPTGVSITVSASLTAIEEYADTLSQV